MHEMCYSHIHIFRSDTFFTRAIINPNHPV